MNKKPNGKKGPGRTSAARAAGANSTDSPMDPNLLERLVKLMTANDLNTVDVRDGEKRVILKRGPAVVAAQPTIVHTTHAPAAHQHQSVASSNAGGAAASEENDFVPIKSPMVGTFYSAPSPDAKPFVSVGSAVDDETDVCVIEAMKVFNNIKAETAGTIAKILVTNGQTVEFGQTLFLVKP